MSSKVIRTHLTLLPKQGSARRFRFPQLSHLQGVALSPALLLTITLATARLSVAPGHTSATGHQGTPTRLQLVARAAPSPKCAGTPSGCHRIARASILMKGWPERLQGPRQSRIVVALPLKRQRAT